MARPALLFAVISAYVIALCTKRAARPAGCNILGIIPRVGWQLTETSNAERLRPKVSAITWPRAFREKRPPTPSSPPPPRTRKADLGDAGTLL